MAHEGVIEALAFRGTVDDHGALVLDERPRWAATLARLRGKRVAVTISRERKVRSLTANRYLWGWIYPVLAEYTGHTSEELHEALKSKILGTQETPFGSVPRGTRDLDEVAFSDFVMRVKVLAAELGCYIPEPDAVAP